VKTDLLGEKPVPAPCFASQSPHGLARQGTRNSGVNSRQIST